MSEAPFPCAAPATLIDLLRLRAAHQSSHEAYTFLLDGETEAVSITYQALDRRAREIATQLQHQGMAGGRALLLYPAGLEYISACFGCLYAGMDWHAPENVEREGAVACLPGGIPRRAPGDDSQPHLPGIHRRGG